MFAIINQNGDIKGFTEHSSYQPGVGRRLFALPENLTNQELNAVQNKLAIVIEDQLLTDTQEVLEAHKQRRVKAVKQEAATRISALDWRVERAKERTYLEVDRESLAEVYIEREAIRRASDRAEYEVLELSSIEDVQGYVWDVQDLDREGLVE